MRRSRTVDWLLLATLLPAWLAIQGVGIAVVWKRAGVAAVGLVLLRSTALAACPASVPVDFPPMCAGEAATASARFCFGDACLLPGVVNGVDPPKAPF